MAIGIRAAMRYLLMLDQYIKAAAQGEAWQAAAPG